MRTIKEARKANNELRGNVCYIYTLTDPRNDLVMYVGKTVDPTSRRIKHFDRKNKSQSKEKIKWILDLYDNGLFPYFTIIKKCPLHESDKHEFAEIEKYRKLNPLLLNKVRVRKILLNTYAIEYITKYCIKNEITINEFSKALTDYINNE